METTLVRPPKVMSPRTEEINGNEHKTHLLDALGILLGGGLDLGQALQHQILEVPGDRGGGGRGRLVPSS